MARNELIASGDESLRRCYDYQQEAKERQLTVNKGEAAYAAYKAIEVLESRFGSEAMAVAALGKMFKEAKRAANKERHIPEVDRLQPNDPFRAVAFTSQVIQKYEQHLLRSM